MKAILENLNKLIDDQLNLLKEGEEALEIKSPESIYDFKAGDTIVIVSENVTIKIQRLCGKIFSVLDASESIHLKKGDLLTQDEGSDLLEVGGVMKFKIFRQIDLPYISNPIKDWRVIKTN